MATFSEAKTIESIYDDVKIEIKEEPIVNHYESVLHRKSVDNNCSHDSFNIPTTQQNPAEPIFANENRHIIDKIGNINVSSDNKHEKINDVCIEEPPVMNYYGTNVDGKNTKVITDKELTTEDEVSQNHEKSTDVINDTKDVEESDRSSDVRKNNTSCYTSCESNVLKAEEVRVVENRQDIVLNIVLERSIECEERIYRKTLGTVEELFVTLQREDLHLLQKSYIDERYRDSESTGLEKLEWQRWISNQAKRFYCRACPFAADHKFDLLIHITEEHEELAAKKRLLPKENMCPGEEPSLVWFKCTECAYMTKHKYTFEKHVISHKQLHEVETFSCASCPYITKLKSSLIKHMSVHKQDFEVVLHRCPICNLLTRNNLYLKKHIQFVHKKEENEFFTCTKCPYKTVYKYLLQKHTLIHSKSRKLYKCPLCPFQTPYKIVLEKTHRLSHEGDELRIFNCANCSYKAKTKENLIKHQLVHRRPDEVTMFKCGICPYETRHRDYIRLHRETHVIRDENNRHPCNLCSYKAKSAQCLRLHHNNIHRNPNEGPMYKCDKCPYQSRSSANVKRHKLTHMNVDEITWSQCDSCEYQAKSKESLKAHFNNVHKEQVPWFNCDKCDFKFKHKGNLKRHKLRHMDPSIANTFHCHQCSFSAKSKNEVRQHMETHTNVILRCNKCKYQTKFTSNLWRHKKDHH